MKQTTFILSATDDSRGRSDAMRPIPAASGPDGLSRGQGLPMSDDRPPARGKSPNRLLAKRGGMDGQDPAGGPGSSWTETRGGRRGSRHDRGDRE